MDKINKHRESKEERLKEKKVIRNLKEKIYNKKENDKKIEEDLKIKGYDKELSF